jgi:EmrB/QacA subfamily drug resistance transporter
MENAPVADPTRYTITASPVRSHGRIDGGRRRGRLMSEADHSAGSSGDGPTHREIRTVYVGLMIVMALSAIDQSIVATALPRILGDLGGLTHLSWVVTAYVLATTTMMPLYGKLSDQYGRKRMLYVAVGLFLLGSILSGFAQSMTQLILFRAVQGLGAGGLLPLAQIIVADLVPPRQRGRYQGWIGAVFAVCSVLGPVVGGIITDALSWHWIFFFNLPIGIGAIAIIGVTLRSAREGAPGSRTDYAGALLLSGATAAFLLALTLGGGTFPWISPGILGLGAAALALAILFFLRQRVASEPILPLHLFNDRVYSLGCLVLALSFMALLGASTYLPLFFQAVMGLSPSSSGLLIAPLAVGIFIAARINGRQVLTHGRYKPAQIAGLAMTLAGFVWLAWTAWTGQGVAVLEPAIALLGLGMGFVTPNMNVAIQNAAPPADIGAATASASFFRSLGGVVGVAGAGAMLSNYLYGALESGQFAGLLTPEMLLKGGAREIASLPPQAHDAVATIYRHAISTTFVAGAVVAALALLALLFLPERPLRTTRQ